MFKEVGVWIRLGVTIALLLGMVSEDRAQATGYYDGTPWPHPSIDEVFMYIIPDERVWKEIPGATIYALAPYKYNNHCTFSVRVTPDGGQPIEKNLSCMADIAPPPWLMTHVATLLLTDTGTIEFLDPLDLIPGSGWQMDYGPWTQLQVGQPTTLTSKAGDLKMSFVVEEMEATGGGERVSITTTAAIIGSGGGLPEGLPLASQLLLPPFKTAFYHGHALTVTPPVTLTFTLPATPTEGVVTVLRWEGEWVIPSEQNVVPGRATVVTENPDGIWAVVDQGPVYRCHLPLIGR